MKKLTALTSLGLNHNRIEDISPLEKLTNLTILNLDRNEIKYINAISNFTNLRSLYIRSNPLIRNHAFRDIVSLLREKNSRVVVMIE